MQLEVPDNLVEALRQALTPILEVLVNERIEQRRTLLLSVADVAEQMSCSRSSVLGLIHGGHLEAVRIGRSYRVATRVLEAYVEELTKPSYKRAIVGRHGITTPPTRPVKRSRGVPARPVDSTAVVPATKPPRPPRSSRPKRPSQAEVADLRCAVAELATRWWGVESATALLDRSGVALIDGPGETASFRYGDLIDWVQEHATEFETWTEEFDPVLGGRGLRQPERGA